MGHDLLQPVPPGYLPGPGADDGLGTLGDAPALRRRPDLGLVAYLGQQRAYAADVGAQLVKDPFVLSPAADGATPFLPDTLTDYFKQTAKKLRIETHFHELRHFAATTAIGAGADIRTVAGRLGHADASVTLRVYAHALEARDRDIARVLRSTVLGP